MKVIVDLCVVPIGVGVHLARSSPFAQLQPQRHHLHGLGPSTRPWNITSASTYPNCLWRNAPGNVPTT